MNIKTIAMTTAITAAFVLNSCKSDHKNAGEQSSGFNVECDRFYDLQVLRYEIPGFEELKPQQKELAYYLYEAANCGRDIIYDQKYRHNLTIRKTLESIMENYKGDRNADDWKKFEDYTKRVFFSNGVHHHYSNLKFVPDYSFEYFSNLVKGVDAASLPLNGMTVDAFLTFLQPIMFDPKVDAKIVDLASGIDNVKASANNFYEDVTQAEVEAYYASRAKQNDPEPISWGLNSKMTKENGQLVEKVGK